MPRPRTPIDVSSHLIEPAAGSSAGAAAPLALLDWRALFGNDHPVELEIGSGKGLFLANAARANPEHNFLGVEISRKYARLAADRLARSGIANARVWSGDIRPVIMQRIANGSLHAVHVYFPDPWWKKRHRKRRVFNAELVEQIARVLPPGGELHVASDVEDYFAVIRQLLAECPFFREQPVAAAREPEHDLDYLTNFERKYRIEGRPIFRASYTRVAP